LTHQTASTTNQTLQRAAERLAAKVYGGKWTASSTKQKDGATSA
jgi:hypothetical protein